MAENDDWVSVRDTAPAGDWQDVAPPAATKPATFDERFSAAPSPRSAVSLDEAMTDPSRIPDAFLDRVRMGQSLQRVMDKATAGFREGADVATTPTGFEDKTLNDLIDLGIFHDPARGGPNAIQFLNEATMMPAAQGWAALMRGLNASLHGAGGLVGQLYDELGAPLGGTGTQAEREVINFGNWAMIEGGMGRFTRPAVRDGAPVNQVIGGLPREADFKAGAEILKSPVAEQNLRDLWQERGIHPAEAVHDAERDAFLRDQLTRPNPEPSDRSGIPSVQGSPVPAGAPRAEIAKTGQAHIDAVLDHPDTRAAVDNPVVTRDRDVPYGAGPDNAGRGLNIDRHFPETMTVDGVTFDPADPFAVHEFVERDVMDRLAKGGMDDQTSYKVAHFEFAEKAEGAWYASHDIDQVRAEAAYRPFLDAIQHENPADPPPNLFRKPYPHDNVEAAKREPIFEAGPTTEEIARAKAILGSDESASAPLRALGADVAADLPSVAQQPPLPPGRLARAGRAAVDQAFGLARNIQFLLDPMATGSNRAMVVAKDAINSVRRIRWEHLQWDQDLVRRFSTESLERMWDAADEESVARQLGESREHQGLVTLAPEERAAVEQLQARAQTAWLHAVDMGMVEGDGLPAYTPRMIINTASATGKDAALPLNGIGGNLRVRTAQMMRRQHMTAEETEAAAKSALGDGAEIARDIRALPLATAKLEDAIAGRKLVDSIKEYGKRTGDDTVSEGGKPGPGWFTLDHPAFRTWRPKFETDEAGATRAAVDDKGNTIFQQTPTYVRGDFEGPLRAVLTETSGPFYGVMMALKGKTMSLIMNSPLIHNAVEWGRALPAMPGKVATFKIYFEGNRAKNNVPLMREAIDNGLVPIGHRFFNQDITSIMEQPNLAPGRSWTAQVLGFVPGLFDEAAGNAVKAAIDKAGDFWHNTLLWDRVADLQMGLYTNLKDNLTAKGVDNVTAARAAAHWANRYAGALPQEAMSNAARKIANWALFSRSFTLGNLSTFKQAALGLPKPVLAQIERDFFNFKESPETGAWESPQSAMGEDAAAMTAKLAKGIARRKAISTILMSAGLYYVGNALIQHAFNLFARDATVDEEMKGYARRYEALMKDVSKDPFELRHLLGRLSPTYDNEPAKQDRAHIGYDKNGTAIYARNPTGKFGEEMIGYPTMPLSMVRRKLSPLASGILDVLENDKGFGRKIYDENDTTVMGDIRAAFAVGKHLVLKHLPEGQLSAAGDMLRGEGDPTVNALRVFGPMAGFTASVGAPGGMARGEQLAVKSQFDARFNLAWPDIRKQIQRGDVAAAREALTAIGTPYAMQNGLIRNALNPAGALHGNVLKNFMRQATPEQLERLERARRALKP